MANAGWKVLVVLAAAQFLMVLALVESYESAQLRALKTGLLLAALLSMAAFIATANLPGGSPGAAAAAQPRPAVRAAT